MIKKAIFGLMHEPPSNHGINRTTCIMADLSRVLRETGRPVLQVSQREGVSLLKKYSRRALNKAHFSLNYHAVLT